MTRATSATTVTGRAGEPLVYTGPAPAQRLASVPSPVVVVRGELAAGELLTDALWALLEPTGAQAASVELGTGTFGHLPFVYPAISEDPAQPVSFSEPHVAPGPAMVLSGSGTVGHRFGERFTHTHAAWLDARGRLRGGHLLPDARVGDVPIEVVLRALPGAEQVSADDPETGMPAFTPRPYTGPALDVPADAPRAVISRVLPGVYLDEAVLRVCREAGFGRARVRASLGSTVGARLLAEDGEVHEVAWPAVEYTQLLGGADLSGPEPVVELQGTLVDIYSEVHNGVIALGENPVAVTFELYVEEVL
ncbi:PCC domain-containing protein [Ornithinimicrobium cavernae]|uniref:PCC domain-containing protein n=1 Tax=Ornithinimicrobium cavernae TaxID=2666047 RepID=UPI000D69039B|nr:DUF296 domain-containing protein [Ornithinimicrobium cavernae]